MIIGRYSDPMSNEQSRKYVKTKFEGVFYRMSSKRDMRTGEQDRIYVFWYADAQGKGHWKTVGRHSEGIRPATARRERTKFLAEFESTGINPVTRDKVTVGQVVDAFNVWGQGEGKYVDGRYGMYCLHLRAKLHGVPLADLTPGLLFSLKAQLLKTCAHTNKRPKKSLLAHSSQTPPQKLLSAATVNDIFSFIRAAINRAIATGVWAGNNPLSTRGGVWKMVKVNNKRLRFLTREEAKALLSDLEKRNQQMHDMVLLALKTGLRPTEIFRLKGQDIDANANILYIVAKGGKRVPVRVPVDMIEMLQGYNRKPTEPVFRRPRTGAALNHTPRCFANAVRKLGLAPEDGDSLYAVTLHTMRHTFASWLAQSGKVSLMELQKLMRHETISMTMRYAHLFPGQESEKLSIIGEILD